ncbi:MAG: PilZ domain-containing protein [Deltaproteobacteria bacterium]|nr:PilZ domain-containing protein [Deltaproteobacteria bacterium]
MINRRWGKRFNIQLKARYGVEEFTHFGYLDDISVFGFFLRSPHTFDEGTQLKIQMMTAQKQLITLEGSVQWERRLHTSMVWIAKDAGMGIKIAQFLNGREHYEALCDQLCRHQAAKKNLPSSSPTALSNEKKSGLLRKLLRR